MKIIDQQNRGKLCEGRNTGMAFGFCKQTGVATFETMMPPSPCKDFLNEPLFTENTGIPTSMYGLSCKKPEGIFEEAIYMAIRMVGTSNSDTSAYHFGKNLLEDRKKLAENIGNIEFFMNHWEKLLDIKERTVIHPSNDNYFLVVGPLDWRKSTYAISLYTLLIRAAIFYTDRKVDPMTFLEGYNYNAGDKGLIAPMVPKLKHFVAKKFLPEQDASHAEQCKNGRWQPHNIGIVNYQILK